MAGFGLRSLCSDDTGEWSAWTPVYPSATSALSAWFDGIDNDSSMFEARDRVADFLDSTLTSAWGRFF